jgi:hypothetical protein
MDCVEPQSGASERNPQVRRGSIPSAEAMDALSRAVRDELQRRPDLADGRLDHPVNGALGQALRRVSAEARADRMSAEHLLIAIKQVLDTMPGLQVDGPLSIAESTHPLRASLVSACIRAYYGRDD